MRIGVYVGSFNPVHKGHIHVANYLLENDYVDKVLILPTPNYWGKQDLVSIQDRVNMLKFYENEKIIIDDIHNNFPYTYQILRSLKKDYNDDLYLIIGSDNLKDFHLWKNVSEILKNKVIVLKRDDNFENYLEDFDRSKFILVDDFDFLDISSTLVRSGNYDLIDENIYNYIRKHKLYGI